MASDSIDTLGDVKQAAQLPRLRRAQNLRRAFLVLVGIFVLTGLTGRLGVRMEEASQASGGYDLKVSYAKVSRLGLATPWTIEVSRKGGFAAPIVVATTSSYFEIFDENGLDPQPTSSKTDGRYTVWEFEPPEGDTLEVSFDARIEPTFRGGRSANTIVRENGRDIVAVRYRTQVMP